MATKLFLRNTTRNGIGATYLDMLTTAGAASTTSVTNTTASGTEIQCTATAGGSVVQWVSGRTPAGGFTLTTTDLSAWFHESATQANAGGRFRVFKRAANGVETELGGGPFNDGVEFGTSAGEMTWAGNVTDTAFAENDRILLKLYITNVGAMGGGRTCTLTYNAADAATGDSFFNIAETVAFKAEAFTLTADTQSYAVTGTDATLKFNRKVSADSGSFSVSGTDATLKRTYAVAADSGAYSISGTTAGLRATRILGADSGSYAVSGTDAALRKAFPLAADSGSFSVTGTDAGLRATRLLSAASGSVSTSGTNASLLRAAKLSAASGSYAVTGTDATLTYGQGAQGYELDADSGSFSVSGTAASLKRGYLLSAGSGSFTLTGSSLTFYRTYVLGADSGSFGVTGTSATLTHAALSGAVAVAESQVTSIRLSDSIAGSASVSDGAVTQINGA